MANGNISTNPSPRAAAFPACPNTADVQGCNLSSGYPLNARLPYLEARLTDHTPGDPLDPFRPDSYALSVKSARVELGEAGVNRAIACAIQDAPKGPLQSAQLKFLPGNRAQVNAWVKWQGVPVPVAATYRIERVDARTVKLSPDAITACGLPARPLLKLLGTDLSQLLTPPEGVPACVEPDGTITLELARLKGLNAPLSALTTKKDELDITVGAAPGAAIAPQRRQNRDAWLAINNQGELAAGPGVLNNASAVLTANKPGAPVQLLGWQYEGTARLERGGASVDLGMLKSQIEAIDPLYKVSDIRLVGTTYKVSGLYNLFVKLPTRLDLNFVVGSDGQLRLVPDRGRVCGLNAPKHAVEDDLASVKFLRKDAQGYVIDLKQIAGLDLPRVGGVANANGRLMLQTP